MVCYVSHDLFDGLRIRHVKPIDSDGVMFARKLREFNGISCARSDDDAPLRQLQ
jgi:hypothetical protein